MAITRSQIARQLMQEGGVPRQGYFLGKLVKKDLKTILYLTNLKILRISCSMLAETNIKLYKMVVKVLQTNLGKDFIFKVVEPQLELLEI